MPEEDFHPSDQMRFQAHEEAASCRFTNVQSPDSRPGLLSAGVTFFRGNDGMTPVQISGQMKILTLHHTRAQAADLEWYKFHVNGLRAGTACFQVFRNQKAIQVHRFIPRCMRTVHRTNGSVFWTSRIPS